MTELIMEELAEMEGKKKMDKIEELKRRIQNQKEMIQEIKKRNPYNGDLSFDEYQLYCMEEELKELQSNLEAK